MFLALNFARRAVRAAVVAGFVLPSVAHAQSSKSTGSSRNSDQLPIGQLNAKVFYACYIPNSGVTYRIKEVDLKQTCSSAEHVMFSWTDGGVAGPQGPQGPIGPQGPTGPKGEPGTPGGWSQTYDTTAFGTVIPAGGGAPKQVFCPAGWTAISGSYEILAIQNPAAPPVVIANYAMFGGLGWQFIVLNKAPGAADAKLNASIRCVK
jgi:hypothetical protein